jgi:two-component system, NarL family, sensor histidine kinase DegS
MIEAQGKRDETAGSELAELLEGVESELEAARQKLEDAGLRLEQSQSEVGRLTARSAAASAALQGVHARFESASRAEIRSAYEDVIEAQQRLFVMRSQVEKIQAERQQLERLVGLLEKNLAGLNACARAESRAAGRAAAGQTVELVIQAQEAERLRLARKMHDQPAQALSNFILQAEIAARLFEADPARARQELAALKNAAALTFQKVRDFIFELHPMMLDDLGLGPALRRFVEVLSEASGVEVRLDLAGGERRLEPYLEVLLFRVVQELASNAVRHSQAPAVEVLVELGESALRVRVQDAGRGFEPEAALEGGMGLRLISERAELLGGFLDLEASPGKGARITFQLPAAPA